MSVFPAIHAERIKPGSFQQPVPIPAALPGVSPFVTVCFNADWLPYILGCLFQLTLPTTWQATTDSELNQALGEANNLILIFQQALAGCQTQNPGFAGAEGGDDFMLRQNPDNPCELQSSVDGITWCTWADISKCVSNKQPAQGTPPTPPGGACTSYQGEVSIGDRWLLPNNVSTGDVVKVSKANGIWSSPLDLFIPRCPDGNLWFEIACVDGTGHTEPGDPAPTINHDSLIGWDGTNYYDFGQASDGIEVSVTIAAGISKAPFYIMCNTPDTSGSGNVVFDAQYCNNAVGTFRHVFDFTAGPQGFSAFAPSGTSGPAGHWVAGVGWQSDTQEDAGPVSEFRRVTIHRTGIMPFALSSVELTWVLVKGTDISGGADQGALVEALPSATVEINQTLGALINGTNDQVGSVPAAATTALEIFLTAGVAAAGTDPGGQITLYQLIVSGSGPDPF